MKEIIVPEDIKYISAFLTMRCNLNCSFCLNAFDKSFNPEKILKDSDFRGAQKPEQNRGRVFDRKGFQEISGERWIQGLDRLVSENVPITFSGGEPFLHKDFIYILTHLKSSLKIDILTNLQWGEKGIERFIEQVDPERIKRKSPYASIRVSYHPEQMQASELVKNAKKLQDAGFSIGIWSVLYPSPEQLSAINQMQFRCKDSGIEFRVKEYTGEYRGQIYGDYSKYPHATDSEETRECLCKTSEILIGTNGNIYRCHRDLYAEEFSLGNLTNPDFALTREYRKCYKYGKCHPCDVKVKTDSNQHLGHTSVDIKDIR